MVLDNSKIQSKTKKTDRSLHTFVDILSSRPSTSCKTHSNMIFTHVQKKRNIKDQLKNFLANTQHRKCNFYTNLHHFLLNQTNQERNYSNLQYLNLVDSLSLSTSFINNMKSLAGTSTTSTKIDQREKELFLDSQSISQKETDGSCNQTNLM